MEIPNTGTIRLYGPSMVNVVSEEIEENDFPHLESLRDTMADVMQRFQGKGLAACQIGVFRRFILVELAVGGILALINPEIVGMRGKEVVGNEGCLSIPPKGNECPVPRQQEIDVRYARINDPKFYTVSTFRDHDAIVIQHEIDHLDGTFFIDRASPSQARAVMARYNNWKAGRKDMADKQKRKVPQLGPLMAGDLVCSACGEIIKPTVNKGKLGVQSIEYKHTNEDYGCSYLIRTGTYVQAEMRAINKDGNEARL